jgi:FAD/FMN-containing dehydrogenase
LAPDAWRAWTACGSWREVYLGDLERTSMSTTVTNYDGSIASTPKQVVRPGTLEELQNILRQRDQYPSPVRAMGSYHSLTPCVSSPGTIVDMKALNKIVSIDAQTMTFTAQAGLEMIEAAAALRTQNLQFILNIEIGNMTLGSAACCHTKDALDGVGFGQVNSFVTGVKWVSPSGTLEEASEKTHPELLPLIRASYGLAGIVYEVTFKIKPLEIVRFNYEVLDVASVTQDHVSQVIASNDAMVCWTLGHTLVIQTRNRATELRHDFLADARRFGWSFLAAFSARAIRQHSLSAPLTNTLEDLGADIELGFYQLLSATGGFTLYDPDKMIDYSKTKPAARYAFTFWAFPRKDWVKNLNDYVAFADQHFKQHGFRCNMPLGSYFIRQDTSSLLSYTFDGDVISLDPIHSPGDHDKDAWANFLREFNGWSHQRGGRPLLNQSPFVTKQHVVDGYGERWKAVCDWVRTADPDGRMVNQFFAELMV